MTNKPEQLSAERDRGVNDIATCPFPGHLDTAVREQRSPQLELYVAAPWHSMGSVLRTMTGACSRIVII